MAVREACKEEGISLPKLMFIDEGDLFEEVLDFAEKLRKEWNLDIIFAEMMMC